MVGAHRLDIEAIGNLQSNVGVKVELVFERARLGIMDRRGDDTVSGIGVADARAVASRHGENTSENSNGKNHRRGQDTERLGGRVSGGGGGSNVGHGRRIWMLVLVP